MLPKKGKILLLARGKKTLDFETQDIENSSFGKENR